MLKKIFILIVCFASAVIALALPIYAAPNPESHWIQGDDGYYYFDVNIIQNELNAPGDFIIIEVAESEKLEIAETNILWTEIYGRKNGLNDYRYKKFKLLYYKNWGNWKEFHMILEETPESDGFTITYGPHLLMSQPSIRKLKNITDIPDSELATVSQLPETTGSVYNKSGNVGDVFFTVSGNQVLANITYFGAYKIKFTMDKDTDMSLFKSGNRVHYYSHEGQKFILINHSNSSVFFSENKNTFVPFTIWNLSTNELETYDRFNTYIYTKKEDANNVYAYFYVDEFVIDHLMNINLAYRYKNNFMIGSGDWKEESIYLEKDVIASGIDPTSWQVDLLTGTAVATGVLAMIPVVRWPALAVGTIAMAWIGSSTQDGAGAIQYGNINQIQAVNNLSDSLKTELNDAYKKADPNFKGTSDTYKVFKLHLGQFNAQFSTGIDIDTEYSVENKQKGVNIAQFTYRTDGKLYTIQGENINPEFTPGPGTDGDNPGVDIPDLTPDFSKWLWIGGIIIVILIIYKNDGFKSLDKLFNVLLTIAIVAALAYGVYFAYNNGFFDELLSVVMRL